MNNTILDVEQMAQWISDHSGIGIETVMTVLDLETDYIENEESFGYDDDTY